MRNFFRSMVALISTVMGSSNVFAIDGQVNFSGQILDSACTVINNQGAPLVVDIGSFSRSAFTGAGSTTTPTKFTLTLTGCPASVTSSSVNFNGTSSNGDDNALELTQETGVATGVGIQIMDSSQTVLPLRTDSVAYPLVTGDNTLDFSARYIATSATVTAGPANSVATFSIKYN